MISTRTVRVSKDWSIRIPKEIRDRLGLRTGDPLAIETQSESELRLSVTDSGPAIAQINGHKVIVGLPHGDVEKTLDHVRSERYKQLLAGSGLENAL